MEHDRLLQFAAAMATVLVARALIANVQRSEQRRPSRLYLRRAELPPNPRDTAWTALYHTHGDRAFITTMGFDVNGFHTILSAGFATTRDTGTILMNATRTGDHTLLGSRRPLGNKHRCANLLFQHA